MGREARYAFRQADDAANRAKDYSFESLRKIYFYDAWRWTIELNQPNSLLRLPLGQDSYRMAAATGSACHCAMMMPTSHMTLLLGRSKPKSASRKLALQKVKKMHPRVKYRNRLARIMQPNLQPPQS